MAFPDNLKLVTLHGIFDEFPAGGAVGSGVITGAQWLFGPAEDSVVPPFAVDIELDSGGAFNVDLPATNDPDWSPVDWTYRFKMTIGGDILRGTFQLDWNDDDAELAEVLQIDGTYSPGVSYASIAQLAAKADQSALTGLTGVVAGKATPADIAAAVTAIPSERTLVLGEAVLPRRDITGNLPLQSGTMFVTHFKGARTQTIQKVQTGTGGDGTQGVGATHCWIGVCRWDGTNYIPLASSVDDPTRWATTFGTYDTQLYAWDHAGEAGHEGFSEVQGVDYALFILWIGAGQVPSLPAGGGWYQDSLKEPRTNALLFTQTQPPAAPISGAFFGPDNRRFQGVLLR